MFGHHHLAVGILAVSSLAAGQTTASKCRCIYGESCWPSQSTFSTLQGQLSQPLINVVPPASACYPAGNPSGDCVSVLTNFADGGWRADQPGAMQSPSWEAFLFPNGTLEGCYMNTTLGLPCLQGNVPPIGVDARNVADVQAAVSFASKNNLKLAVKNTGHDYLGRSAGRGAFMLWTHHQAVTFGSGIQWGEAYEFVNQQGRFILGGISMGGTVGAAGGWILGAGHSTFAPFIGVDNVLEFKVVLADGKLATVNAFQNPDLWWALRGGGGGTFGVLISVTYQTHDIFPFAQSTLSATFDTPEIAQRVVTQFIKLQPTLADLGWGGFTFFTAAGIQINYVAPNYDSVKAEAAFSPFADFVTNATDGQTQVGYTEFGNFPDWFQVVFAGGPAQVGSPTEVTGRLLQRDMAENHADEVARAVVFSI